MSDAAWIALAQLLVNVLVLGVTGVWQLNRNRALLEKHISKNREDTAHVIAELREDMDDKFARSQREAGETAQAIRQKVNEVELWSRDNFVRRESFYQVVNQLQENFRLFCDKIETKIDKLGDRLTDLHKPPTNGAA